jgi:glycosyltransferase involved in cell wall biosynthesis
VNAPLVTVLTTTYNHEKYVGNCIRSVLGQTIDSWEQIVVDDGSTDNTGEIVKSFNDERIIYVRQQHVGINRLSETYNRGLKLASGKFISILEGDDMYPRHKLGCQLSLMGDSVLSFGNAVLVNQNNKFLGMQYQPKECEQFLRMKDWLSPLLVKDYIIALSTMIDKDALIGVGGFSQPSNTAAVDYSTFLELARVGQFKFINEVLGIWVKHGDNYSDLNLFDKTNVTGLYSDTTVKYVFPFCRKYGIDIDWKALSEQRSKDLFHIARHYMLSGKSKEAREIFKRSFKLGSVSDKLKSLSGMVLSMADLNFESLAGVLGRPTER